MRLTNIQGKTINDAVYKSIKEIITNGYRSPSRNGDISTIYNAFVQIEFPRSRHLSLAGRKNNIFATIGETFWVFAGSNKIDPFLSFILPRARDYSDDGLTWRGGYPERIANGNQIMDTIQQFKNEGIFTRRAVTVIYDANIDTADNLKSVYGLEATKDRPCNLIMDFFITPDKCLHMNVKSRSGDVLWGFGSINIFEWTFYQEMILQYIQHEVDQSIKMGSYNHHVTNLHLYDFNGAQGYDVLREELAQVRGLTNDYKCIFPEMGMVHNFFEEIVDAWGLMIQEESTGFFPYRRTIEAIFSYYRVPIGNNLLYDYAKVVTAYIACKNMKLEKGEMSDIVIDLDTASEEFFRSLRDSSFRKFRIDYKGEIV